VKNKARILYLVNHLRYGGAEIGLLTTLKNIDRARFDCSVVSVEKKGEVAEEIESAGIPVTYLNTRSALYNLPAILAVLDIIKKERPDILHTSLFYSNFFGRIAALMLFGPKPIIITEERSMYTEKRFYHVIIDNLLSHVTDRIIACSKSVVDFTARQEGIRKEKFHLIYNAVDSTRFDIPETKDAIRRRRGFSERDFIVGTVGSIIPKKGHKFLIDACAGLAGDIPELKLVIVGDGEIRTRLERYVSAQGLAQKIKFPGQRKDVPEIVKMMDVFVLPSLQEGFPRTLVEAMYEALPVCAARISGIPELIRDGENGFLFEPGNVTEIAEKIFMLYNNADLRNRIGASARRTIESGYLPADYLKSLEGLYVDLLKRGTSKARW